MLLSQLQVVTGQVATSFSKFAMHGHIADSACAKAAVTVFGFSGMSCNRKCQRSRSAFRVSSFVPTGRADGNALAKLTVACFAATGFAPNLSGRRVIPLAADCCSGENI